MSEPEGAARSLFSEGHSCWRIARARRATVLVDGADYFEAAAEALERARHAVLVVGWDVHSRVRLRRRERASDEGFAALLERIAARRNGPRIHLLAWDWPMLYALEREALPRLRIGRGNSRRVQFRLDSEHPFGGSQHQKVMVIDDAAAFCGGIDLTSCRWDTSEHRPHDSRRADPGFPDYGPFHDVQMAVDGEAARALGDLLRERWRRATGKRLAPCPHGSDPWPTGVEPDFEDVDVAIARTEPAHRGRPEVREVEALYVDALRSAREHVYLENQYLTSSAVGKVLEELLQREAGPEIVIVGPRASSGWLEERTMTVLRARLVERLRKADRAGRLRVYHPVLPAERGVEEPDEHFTVHSKVMIVDDRILRIGSANLADRSMGLDSECDLAIEAAPGSRHGDAIARIRDALLCEHLGVEPGSVAKRLAAGQPLVAAVEGLRGSPRTLAPLEVRLEEWVDALTPAGEVLDPERPIELEEFVQRALPESVLEESARTPWIRLAALGIGVAAIAAAWRFTPLGELAEAARLTELAAPLLGGPGGFALAVLVFSVAGLLEVPVTALVVACALLFGWSLGTAAALLGSLLSAGIGYAAGSHLARDVVQRWMGRRAHELSRRIGRRGLMAVVALRVVPVAPFAVVNLAAGASHIGWRDFALGTLLGMTPGIVLLCLAADRTVAAIGRPDWPSALGAAALAVALVGGGVLARRLVSRRRR